ncbi:MAG: methylated-DNA--[protein]-cysteine S-methyltransferase [Pseudomonadota bacterium]|nr:methylated-DNA--[protein]-cysteine S-methyltransferase [Pseudomonadota bacterium]
MTVKKKIYMNTLETTHFTSPLGLIMIQVQKQTVRSCYFDDEPHVQNNTTYDSPTLTAVMHQLQEYFQGQRKHFVLELAPQGSTFDQLVWQQLSTIAYASTVSYQDIASAIGRPQAARAVGQAIGRNPLAILIPCHRIIRRQGTWGGYSAGLWRKTWLLEHEHHYQ